MQAGEAVYVAELVARGPAAAGSSVRVFGRVSKIDVRGETVTIEFEGAGVEVETRLLGAMPFKAGSLFQFIGEVAYHTTTATTAATEGRMDTRAEQDATAASDSDTDSDKTTGAPVQSGGGRRAVRTSPGLRVVARVGACVDGLDTRLYKEALALRRAFLAANVGPTGPPIPPEPSEPHADADGMQVSAAADS